MLSYYDLADLVAAIASNKQHQSNIFVVGPVDEMHNPLAEDATSAAYKFASAQAGSSISVIPGAFSEAAATEKVLGWLLN